VLQSIHKDQVTCAMVAFRTAGQDYCIDIMSVQEIRGWVPATILPHAPDYLRGVINLRGAVVPIIDLSVRLGFGKSPENNRNVIIITSLDSRIIGLLVETVSDILGVEKSSIQPIPQIVDEGAQEFIKGVIIADTNMIHLIDIRHLLGTLAGPVQ
jgi:purine-binding chemotaxis protein CheW